jgi:hypothetical protein
VRTLRAARVAAVVAAVGIALSACSVSTESPSSDTEPTTDKTSAQTTEDSTAQTTAESTEDSSPDIVQARTWLYELTSDANFDSGAQIGVAVAGGDGQVHNDSTSQWLGCDGVAAVTVYELDGAYSTLDGTLAFREGTPADVLGEVEIETDLGVLGAYQVDSDGGVPLQLLLDGATTLTVTAAVSAGECENDDVGYLVFVDTYLT